VKIWTVHLKDQAEPVLVREGFSLGALVFGPLWLAAHRAWIPAAFALAAGIAIGAVATGGARNVLELGLAVLLGLSGRDLWRWSLARRGYVLSQVVTAPTADGAFERLLTRRPDLGEGLLRASLS
jgi:hypothetical protein